MRNPIPRRLIATFALLAALPLPVRVAPAASVPTERVAFRIRTLLDPKGARTALTDATVEGAPGTDIALEARTRRFSLTATLKTDVMASGRVRIVANLVARRHVGDSERGLPLYEEDAQDHVVELATDGSESLVVLPFGRNPGGEELAIDVEPSLTDQPARDASGALLPPEIRIVDLGRDGWLHIQATKIPHRFDVVAALVRDGRTIATGRAVCELGEPGTVPLGDLSSVRLTVAGYGSGCPTDRVDVEFDLLRDDTTLASHWAGSGSSGEPFEYSLGALGAELPGQPTALRLRIHPLDQEKP